MACRTARWRTRWSRRLGGSKETSSTHLALTLLRQGRTRGASGTCSATSSGTWLTSGYTPTGIMMSSEAKSDGHQAYLMLDAACTRDITDLELNMLNREFDSASIEADVGVTADSITNLLQPPPQGRKQSPPGSQAQERQRVDNPSLAALYQRRPHAYDEPRGDEGDTRSTSQARLPRPGDGPPRFLGRSHGDGRDVAQSLLDRNDQASRPPPTWRRACC